MSGLPSDKVVKRYIGSWDEFLDSIGVSWDEEYDDEEEMFEANYCQHCPDKDHCVLDPDEWEDECPRLGEKRSIDTHERRTES